MKWVNFFRDAGEEFESRHLLWFSLDSWVDGDAEVQRRLRRWSRHRGPFPAAACVPRVASCSAGTPLPTRSWPCVSSPTVLSETTPEHTDLSERVTTLAVCRPKPPTQPKLRSTQRRSDVQIAWTLNNIMGWTFSLLGLSTMAGLNKKREGTALNLVVIENPLQLACQLEFWTTSSMLCRSKSTCDLNRNAAENFASRLESHNGFWWSILRRKRQCLQVINSTPIHCTASRAGPPSTCNSTEQISNWRELQFSSPIFRFVKIVFTFWAVFKCLFRRRKLLHNISFGGSDFAIISQKGVGKSSSTWLSWLAQLSWSECWCSRGFRCKELGL